MNKLTTNSLVVLMAVFGGTQIHAQFSSGSDGSFGPIDIQVNTAIDLPPDGIIHATTINVAASRLLNFKRNANNTPVYLLATGDITIIGDIGVSGARGNNTVGGLSGPGGRSGVCAELRVRPLPCGGRDWPGRARCQHGEVCGRLADRGCQS